MNSATSSNGPTLYPTLVGYIETDQDKSSIIDACLSGDLHHIPRFPQHELRHLIRSGNIFVFADYPTGNGHWNDGKSWTLVGWENGLHIEREHDGPQRPYEEVRDPYSRRGFSTFRLLLQNQAYFEWDVEETFADHQSSNGFCFVGKWLVPSDLEEIDTALFDRRRRGDDFLREDCGNSQFNMCTWLVLLVDVLSNSTSLRFVTHIYIYITCLTMLHFTKRTCLSHCAHIEGC